MSEPTLLLSLTVPGDPVPKGRPRLGQGRTFSPRRTTQAEQDLGWQFRAAGATRNEHDELGVRVVFRCSTRQRRDVDNCVKLVLDAANGIVWRDDVQVVRLEADMHRGVDDPSTTVQVWVVRALARHCETCGQPLTARQDRYCSAGCYGTGQRRGAYRRCAGCGADVYRQADKADAATVFCSPECQAKRRGKCRRCSQPLNAPPSSSRVFCSPGCSSAWWREQHAVKKPAGTCDCGSPRSRGATRCRPCHVQRFARPGATT